MKKFEQALLAAEQQNKLKRVRLKLDPKIREAQDYSQYEGYEGYVLSETETHIELQIKDKRIMLPKVVLENKLLDFMKGAAKTAAPGIYRDAKNLYNKAAQTANYYATDPNVSTATKLGRGAGKAAKVAANVLLNPLTTIKAAERFASAPTRLVGKILGVKDDDYNKWWRPDNNEGNRGGDRDSSGSSTSVRFEILSMQPADPSGIGTMLINAATAQGYSPPTVDTAISPAIETKFYSSGINTQNTLIIVGAKTLGQQPPPSQINNYYSQIVRTIDEIKQNRSPKMTLPVFQSIDKIHQYIAGELQTSLQDVNENHQLTLFVLNMQNLKISEMSGVLALINGNQNNANVGQGFVLNY